MLFRLLRQFYAKYRLARRISRYRYTSDLIQRDDCSFGRYTYGYPRIVDYASGTKLSIGAFCCIAYEVTFLLGGEHYLERAALYYPPYLPSNLLNGDTSSLNKLLYSGSKSKGDIVVGNDVWFGYGALVLSGVHIGNGAVIGAGAVIAKDVPPYAIVAGNPARIIRYRFDETTIKALERIAWWNWSEDKIKAKLPLIFADSPDALIAGELGANWRNVV